MRLASARGLLRSRLATRCHQFRSQPAAEGRVDPQAGCEPKKDRARLSLQWPPVLLLRFHQSPAARFRPPRDTVHEFHSGTRNPPNTFVVLRSVQNGEQQMLTRTFVALGFVGAMTIGTPAPTLAQGVYVGPGGVRVDTGRPAYLERRYRADRSYAYERGRFGGCRTVTIERDDGRVRRIRRCD